jgi:molybdenum cofactor biosynthesis enzyme MoaA
MNIDKLLLDFRITSRCNMNCDLCFRNPGIEDQPLTTIKKILKKLYTLGFKRIGITGGRTNDKRRLP